MKKPHRENLRVAIVYRMDHPGGVQSVALALIRGLNKIGIVPDILWDIPPNENFLIQAKCKANFEKLKFKVSTSFIDRMPNSIRYLLWILNCIQEHDLNNRYDFYYIFFNGFIISPQVSHLRYLSGSPLLPQLENRPSGLRGLPIKIFEWFYNHLLKKNNPIYEYHRDNYYVINSRYTAELFKEAHNYMLPIIYPPINISGRVYEKGDIVNRDLITFFSRIVDYKRPDLILDLAEKYPHLKFVIMGAVPSHRIPFLDSLKSNALSRKINNIDFIPNPNDEEVRSLLSKTKIYIFPAENEHFGMTTVEAIASGAVPFVHDSGGQKEIVNLDYLRFNYDQIFQKFDLLINKKLVELEDIRELLSKDIDQFTEEVSVGKMLSYLNFDLSKNNF